MLREGDICVQTALHDITTLWTTGWVQTVTREEFDVLLLLLNLVWCH